jgi:ATP-dependent DNA ligase
MALLHAQHVARTDHALSAETCALDLEGIVAKLADAPYRATQPPHWLKIKNPSYSQAEGRHQLFERRAAH